MTAKLQISYQEAEDMPYHVHRQSSNSQDSVPLQGFCIRWAGILYCGCRKVIILLSNDCISTNWVFVLKSIVNYTNCIILSLIQPLGNIITLSIIYQAFAYTHTHTNKNSGTWMLSYLFVISKLLLISICMQTNQQVF